MPASAPFTGYRICIVILTYKRNAELLRLASQCREFIDRYRGHNRYELCVSDSDHNNPIAPLPAELKLSYCLNPGTGFDENIFYFWQNHLDDYDFIFSFGDDDLFAPWLNPLYLLDAAIETGHQAALFNNRPYKWHSNGSIELRGVDFPETALVADKNVLMQRVFSILPSHVGILYSTALLRRTLKTAWEFRGTLHLYAFPILFAASEQTLLFSDCVLCLYHDDERVDGAWIAGEAVMTGVLKFLLKLRHFAPAHLYQVSQAGYLAHYFVEGSWLRTKLSGNPRLPSEAEIRLVLARPEGAFVAEPTPLPAYAHAPA